MMRFKATLDLLNSKGKVLWCALVGLTRRGSPQACPWHAQCLTALWFSAQRAGWWRQVGAIPGIDNVFPGNLYELLHGGPEFLFVVGLGPPKPILPP